MVDLTLVHRFDTLVHLSCYLLLIIITLKEVTYLKEKKRRKACYIDTNWLFTSCASVVIGARAKYIGDNRVGQFVLFVMLMIRFLLMMMFVFAVYKRVAYAIVEAVRA